MNNDSQPRLDEAPVRADMQRWPSLSSPLDDVSLSAMSSDQQVDMTRCDVSLATAVCAAINDARVAQRQWGATSVTQRLAVARRWRHGLAYHASTVAATVDHLAYRQLADTLVAEVLPLADACRFLEQEAPSLLAPRRYSKRGRPGWMRGVTLEIHREPYGVILVIGPRHYPLFLPGVHVLQALIAGNAVLLKPGVGGTSAARALQQLWVQAGLDARLFCILPESPEAAQVASRSGIDKVVLTGSYDTGRVVLRELAHEVIPAVCELSGCDAVFVQHDADLDLVTRALQFGLQFNGSETCIAPRRVFVHHSILPELERRLVRAAAGWTYRALPCHISELSALKAARRQQATVYGEKG